MNSSWLLNSIGYSPFDIKLVETWFQKKKKRSTARLSATWANTFSSGHPIALLGMLLRKWEKTKSEAIAFSSGHPKVIWLQVCTSRGAGQQIRSTSRSSNLQFHIRLCKAIRCSFLPYPCKNLLHLLRSIDIIWDLLRSLEISWDLLRSLKIIWDLLRSFDLEISLRSHVDNIDNLTILTLLIMI